MTKNSGQKVKKDKRIQIGIIGVGYVGDAVKHWFEKQKDLYNVFLYDKFKNIGSLEEVNKADIIFVCVPTPFHPYEDLEKQGYDDSAVADALANIQDGKVAVIKSTILPISTEKFQEQYPEKIILFNPEFLRAKTANEDFLRPERQIVGYANEAGKEKAQDILDILPQAPYERILRAREAEMIKYFGNSFLATRVVFANQMYDICQKLGIDYEQVKKEASRDTRIGESHFTIFEDGYRGYAGACLPKDVRALSWFARQSYVDATFLEILESINNRLRDA